MSIYRQKIMEFRIVSDKTSKMTKYPIFNPNEWPIIEYSSPQQNAVCTSEKQKRSNFDIWASQNRNFNLSLKYKESN